MPLRKLSRRPLLPRSYGSQFLLSTTRLIAKANRSRCDYKGCRTGRKAYFLDAEECAQIRHTVGYRQSLRSCLNSESLKLAVEEHALQIHKRRKIDRKSLATNFSSSKSTFRKVKKKAGIVSRKGLRDIIARTIAYRSICHVFANYMIWYTSTHPDLNAGRPVHSWSLWNFDLTTVKLMPDKNVLIVRKLLPGDAFDVCHPATSSETKQDLSQGMNVGTLTRANDWVTYVAVFKCDPDMGAGQYRVAVWPDFACVIPLHTIVYSSQYATKHGARTFQDGVMDTICRSRESRDKSGWNNTPYVPVEHTTRNS